jgi:hypothetical protein
MRVFAMVDPWTQWVMAPLHKGLFKLLNHHHMIDGTFNQLGPILRAFGSNKPLFSMDLSSATDRLPIALQAPIIGKVFNLSDIEVQAWVNLLVGRDYMIPTSAKLPEVSVRYSVGQPMGALSSWAMLAITHHFIVQCAAWMSGTTPVDKLYTDYAVLGDDIVIFNAVVAKKYHYLILALGVECNLAKSVLSPKGKGLEFAKRTFLNGVNVSPFPLKEYWSALTSPVAMLEVARKYNLTLQQLLTVCGFGYKVKAGINQPVYKQNLKIQYLLLMSAISPDRATSYMETFGQLKPWLKKPKVAMAMMSYTLDFAQTIIRDAETLVKLLTPGGKAPWIESLAKSMKLSYYPKLFLSQDTMMMGLTELTLNSVLQELLSAHTEAKETVADSIHQLDDWMKYDLKYHIKHGLPVDEIDNVLNVTLGTLNKLMNIKSELDRLSKDAIYFRKQVVSRRIGSPKLFRLHNSLHKWLINFPTIQTPIDPKGSNRHMLALIPKEDILKESAIFGYVGILILKLGKLLLKRPLKTIIFSFFWNRLIWFSSFLFGLIILSGIFGISKVYSLVLTIWGIIISLMGSESPFSWTSYLVTIVTHGFEMICALMILACFYHYDVTIEVIMSLISDLQSGSIGIFEFIGSISSALSIITWETAKESSLSAIQVLSSLPHTYQYFSGMSLGLLLYLVFVYIFL